jgi:hypothetical protein
MQDLVEIIFARRNMQRKTLKADDDMLLYRFQNVDSQAQECLFREDPSLQYWASYQKSADCKESNETPGPDLIKESLPTVPCRYPNEGHPRVLNGESMGLKQWTWSLIAAGF